MNETPTPTDEFDAMRVANIETIQAWVTHASGGFLTVEYFERRYASHLSIRRTDGAPLDGDAADPATDRPVIGVLFDIYVPTSRRLTRRNRRTMVEIRDAVRRMLVRYVADPPMAAYSGLSSFEYKNGLR